MLDRKVLGNDEVAGREIRSQIKAYRDGNAAQQLGREMVIAQLLANAHRQSGTTPTQARPREAV